MKRPNRFLFLTLGFLLVVFAFFKGQRIHRKARLKGPAIILSNHTSFFDFVYTTAAIWPRRVSYMAAAKMFYDPVLGPFLRLARAFPKSLFQADPVATLNVFRILRQKGIVSIFPEGQISPIGVTLPIGRNIAKLLKKAGADVFVARHAGAYLTNPPWSKRAFPGRVETTVDLLIAHDRLAAMTEAEIHAAVVAGLAYNTHADNALQRRRHRVNVIDNLESVLYRCPSCGMEHLRSEGRELVCPDCGCRFAYDRYGQVGGRRIDELYRLQETEIARRIDVDPEFALTAPVRLESYRNDRVVEVGSGTLTLTPSAYRYDGTVDGAAVALRFDPKTVPTLPSDLGRNVQIYDGAILYQFVMDDRCLPTQFVIAGERIHALSTRSQDV